ncbi:MAG TPA: LacI family DNA-binding transcriptional regulator [Solirubrobacteraceae bacterium]|jgi:DNA-binding LacI/PurR family transcriptional regulator|nr:LacI family DNA-binding transcriptional regulator [Solirubrobacteraceae bacterium]
MPASIHDVAQRAGVSVATVSRSYTVPETVREATRVRVLEAAAELGYRPNRAARGLITGRTGNVGVIVPDIGNPYFQGVLKGAQARAREADYAVFVADGQESAAEEEALIGAMSKQVDGILLCSSRLAPGTLAALERAPAVALLNRRVDGLSTVTVDSADGMRQAMTHLAALGHERCAFLSGPRRSWSNQQRLRGLRTAARAAGAQIVTIGPVAPQFEGGVDAAEQVLASGATAVLAYNDLVAAGMLSRLAQLGVEVPGALSVVGFDDIPLAAMLTPALTTVAAPTTQAGAAAVEALLSRLERPDAPPSVQQLPARLVVRGSTARPGARRAGGPLLKTNQGAV